MTESNFALSSQAQITSEEIEKRSFSSKVRGISESEVRSFLRRVSEEITRLSDNEQKLIEKLNKYEKAQDVKHVATKQELLESLGEQTARILVGAEEAAEQMVTDAELKAKEISDKSKADFEEMEIKTADKKTSNDKELEEFFESSKKQAIKNAEMIVENARVHGREIFQEATVLREKILKDLLRRRELLSEQIDELRKGREELLDSYKVVKGSFQKATDALVGVEEKASSELMHNPIDVDELLAAHVELPAILNSSNAIEGFTDENIVETKIVIENKDEVKKEGKESMPETPASSSVTIVSKDAVPTKPVIKPNEELAPKEIYNQEDIDESQSKKSKSLKNYMKGALGVDALSQDQVNAEVDLIQAEIDTEIEVIQEEIEAEDKKDVSELFKTLKTKPVESPTKNAVKTPVKDSVMRKTEPENSVKDPEKPKQKSEKKTKAITPIAVRDESIAKFSSSILRKAKKQLQNEQNELLDALRTTKSKKRLKADEVLPSIDAHIKIWEENLREEIESVFELGAKSVSNKKVAITDEIQKNIISWVITPLRESLSTAIDEGEVADLSTRVGAKYREWRNSDLKIALSDVLCSTYSNGVLNAAPKDSMLSWMVEKPGKCVDCDDNALEPTKVNEQFPTGQSCAPAHSGCRCVITLG